MTRHANPEIFATAARKVRDYGLVKGGYEVFRGDRCVGVCTLGALGYDSMRCFDDLEPETILLAEVIGIDVHAPYFTPVSIGDWNDNPKRTKEEVLAVLAEAEQIARDRLAPAPVRELVGAGT